MKEKTVITQIEKIIKNNIGKDSEKSQLAYLGLTSKSESHFRDRISYHLSNYYNDKYYVLREWKNCDIAIIDKDFKTIALIELKVCYSCDLMKDGTLKEYTEEIKNDLKKSKQLADPNCEIHSILFVTKPKERIPDSIKPIIKYSSSINATFNKYEYADVIEKIGEANFRIRFPNVDFKLIKHDSALGIKCSFEYCVITNAS